MSAVPLRAADRGRQQYVELRFSDPLKTQQNLQGLVETEKRDHLRFVVNGSIVHVFSGKGFRGEQKVRVAAGIRSNLSFVSRATLPARIAAVVRFVLVPGPGARRV